MLNDLPAEILHIIAGFVHQGITNEDAKNFSLLSLSQSCTRLHHVFGPIVFSKLTVKRDDGYSAFNSLLKTHGHFVGELTVLINLRPGYRQPRTDLFRNPKRLLLEGSELPNCRSVEIQFVPRDDFEEGRWNNADKVSIQIWEDVETETELMIAEESYQWRGDLAAMWRALSRNANCRYLTLCNLPPKLSGALRTAPVRRFLSRVETLHVQFWGGFCSNSGGESPSMPGYGASLDLVGAALIEPAENLEHLLYAYSEWGMCDPELSNLFEVLSLRLGQLSSLLLQNAFIERDLMEMIANAGHSLRAISFRDCFIHCPGHNEGGHMDFTWADVWALMMKTMESLGSVRFHISNMRALFAGEQDSVIYAEADVRGREFRASLTPFDEGLFYDQDLIFGYADLEVDFFAINWLRRRGIEAQVERDWDGWEALQRKIAAQLSG